MAKKNLEKSKNKQNINQKNTHNNTKKNKKIGNKKDPKTGEVIEKKVAPVPLKESVKEHFFTFQLKIDLFTVLYSTLVFKWIQTDRVK